MFDHSVNSDLARLATRGLSRCSELYEKWIYLVRSAGWYRGSWVDEYDLQTKADRSFELILRKIAGQPISEDLALVSEQVGRRRANQGVSLTEVQEAANLDFQIVWEMLLDEASKSEVEAMLLNAPSIWAIVGAHAREIRRAYLERTVEVDRRSEDVRRDWLVRLQKSHGERPDIVEKAADVLGFLADSRFLVFVADREHAAALRKARDLVTSRGIPTHYQEIEQGDLLVAQAAPHEDAGLWNPLRGVRCAIAPPAHGLAEVPNAITIASVVLSALPPEQSTPGRIEDAWSAVAASQAPLVVNALAESTFKELMKSSDAELLVETALTYCYSDGTISRVAKQLHCHRNTVLNRLEKLRQLSGYDIRVPRDAAAFLFAAHTYPDIVSSVAATTAKRNTSYEG